jgi:hypothetical protein
VNTSKMAFPRWSRFVTRVATFAIVSATALSFSGCGGSSTGTVATVAAPGAPTALTVTGGENVATLQWSPPAASATTGEPATYEIYRSTTATTAATLVDPANRVVSIAAVAGQTTPYSYTALNLEGANTLHYFVVTAKNAGGETPSAVASDNVTGPRTPQSYGNNFSAALIFADDIGISNLTLGSTSTWAAGIADVTAIDYNTGLRPLSTEVAAFPVAQTTLPYLTVTSKIDPSYYEQKSINTWQGEWAKGAGTPQNVNAKWGDNLVSATLSAGAKIRIEMVLTKDVSPATMTVYPMKLLSGSGINELQGTTGVATTTTTAFVFATNARLKIQKLDASGTTPILDVDNQALFDPSRPDGTNKLSAEIPVSGNFTYGYVWDPATSGSAAGKYRITFSLDANSAFGTGTPANNTSIQTATNGVLDSATQVHIDVDVK